MADFGRGIKAGAAAAAVYLIISVILAAIVHKFLYLSNFIYAAGLTSSAGFTSFLLMDPSSVISLFFEYVVRGIIFGAVFAALYNFLPGITSVKKGVVLSSFLWIGGAIWLIYITPGWPSDDGVQYSLVTGLMVSLASLSLALVSIASALVFGALTGFLWDRFRAKRLAKARKGSPVLLLSYIFGVLMWTYFATTFTIGVLIGGAPAIDPDVWWYELLNMLVVFLGLPGFVLADIAWRKAKVDKSGFKWGVAGGVLMALTGIMLLPGALAITGGVLSRRIPASEPSTAAIAQ